MRTLKESPPLQPEQPDIGTVQYLQPGSKFIFYIGSPVVDEERHPNLGQVLTQVYEAYWLGMVRVERKRVIKKRRSGKMVVAVVEYEYFAVLATLPPLNPR